MKKSLHLANGHVISYTEFGDENGFPILINHGLIASIDDYDLFKRLIGLKAHLIAIARPGYGESSPFALQNIAEWADLVEVVVDHLGLTQLDVLGISSGAPYSYALGYKFPDRVRNIYIFSGIPALFDERVQSLWPFEVTKNASITEMQSLARRLFFANLSDEDLERNDIKDSMMNDCFGIALDLKIRGTDWGFRLSDVRQKTFMQHCKTDDAVPFVTAELTSKMLPNCNWLVREDGGHFSEESLDDFIRSVIVENYETKSSATMA